MLAFHFELTGFESGYLGVDAFFVVSGYLITGILLKDISAKRFSYVTFLSRRANRLLPALGLMAFLTTIFAWHAFSTGVLSRFGESLLGVASYTSNFVFMFDGGYFQQSNATTPLLHTWSLSVEEQFYLLFPLLLLFLYKVKIEKLFQVVFLLSIISFVTFVYLLDFQSDINMQEFAFFMLPTRAWELGAGGLLAIKLWKSEQTNSQKNTNPRNTILSNIFATTGVFALFMSQIIGAFHSHRGISSSLIVLAIVLLIGNSQSTVIGYVLRSPILTKLGLMSYGLYLYHFPILAAFKLYLGTNELDLSSKVLASVITLTMSFLSLKFFENPIRFGALKTRTSGFLAAAFLLVLLGLAFLSKLPAQEKSPEVIAAEILKRNEYTYFNDLDERLFQNSRLEGAGGDFEGDTIVVGSSRIMSVNSDLFGVKVLNLSVSGATIEDIYSLALPGLRASGQNRILIGLDPWILNKNNKESRWKSQESNFNFWRITVVNQTPLSSVIYPGAFSPQRQTSLALKIYDAFNLQQISQIPEDGRPEILAKKAKDGSIIYGLEYQSMTSEDIRAGFSSNQSYAGMHAFQLSESNLTKIQSLISYLKANSTGVEIVLSPYHPELYPELASNSTGYKTAEQVFIDMAKQQGIIIRGSYNPLESDCRSDEFYDGMHPKEACMVKVLKNIRD